MGMITKSLSKIKYLYLFLCLKIEICSLHTALKKKLHSEKLTNIADFYGQCFILHRDMS